MQQAKCNQDGSPPNGPALAAIVSAAAGCFAIGVFYVAGIVSPAFSRVCSIYEPAGALSGVSVATCLAWLAVWAVLHLRWRRQEIATVGRLTIVSLVLLAGGLLLTFPPVARLF